MSSFEIGNVSMPEVIENAFSKWAKIFGDCEVFFVYYHTSQCISISSDKDTLQHIKCKRKIYAIKNDSLHIYSTWGEHNLESVDTWSFCYAQWCRWSITWPHFKVILMNSIWKKLCAVYMFYNVLIDQCFFFVWWDVFCRWWETHISVIFVWYE